MFVYVFDLDFGCLHRREKKKLKKLRKKLVHLSDSSSSTLDVAPKKSSNRTGIDSVCVCVCVVQVCRG